MSLGWVGMVSPAAANVSELVGVAAAEEDIAVCCSADG